ncbi:hypothetical protein DR62_07245 [Burkholderia thailandensis]|nr:hypothetical protein DR62_07245 [Burkholderia thailandensis]AOI54448.1 hypothetical protein WI24_21635 [Burkholderia thailandensis]
MPNVSESNDAPDAAKANAPAAMLMLMMRDVVTVMSHQLSAPKYQMQNRTALNSRKNTGNRNNAKLASQSQTMNICSLSARCFTDGTTFLIAVLMSLNSKARRSIFQ